MSDFHSSKHPIESPPGVPPEWIPQVLTQILQLGGLPANWDSYGALAPNKPSIQFAEEFIKSLSVAVEIEKPEVSLTANGHVTFLWESHDGVRNLDVEMLPDGTINYVHADEEDESRDEEGQTQNGVKIIELLTQS